MPPRPVPEDAATVGAAPAGGASAASVAAELEKRLTAQAEALVKRLAGQFKATPDKPAPTESAERRKQRGQGAAARKAAATAAAADKAKAKFTK
eukprot:jgi/Tetstr1/465880/TSEL_010497.t1